MKKIAFLIPDLYTGGMPRVLESLTNNMSKNKYSKMVICLKEKPINFNMDCHVVSIAKEGNTYLTKLFIEFLRLYKVWKLCRQNKFDAVISFGMTANIINVFVNKYGKKILTEHNVKSIENRTGKHFGYKLLMKVYNMLIKNTYNYADKIINVSAVIGNDLNKNYGVDKKLIYTIYNGVDDKKIKELAKEKLNIDEGKLFQHPVILNVGALSFQKAQWHLIRIMPYINKYVPKANLVLIGEGALCDAYISLVQKMQLKNVYILGKRNNPYKYMANASIFALSSDYEGFPNVLVEAATVGIAIVSTDCLSGPREFLTISDNINKETKDIEYGAYGILAPRLGNGEFETLADAPLSKSEISFAKAVVKLLTEKGIRGSYKNKSIIRAENFTANKMAAEYEAVLDEAILC